MIEINRTICGDALEVLRTFPDNFIDCCVTSPPYFGLRDYQVDGQIGLEKTPEEFVSKMVEVFTEVKRVLKGSGTLWLNLGDSYAGSGCVWGGGSISEKGNHHSKVYGEAAHPKERRNQKPPAGLKPKDLIGIPWAVAFALRQPTINYIIKDEAWRGWVAGLVDGEGCITILKTKSSHSESLSFPPIVQIRMADKNALEKLVELLGSKLSPDQLPPSHIAQNQRPSWQWKLVSEKAADLIAEIYPYLTVKRKQAIVAWNHQLFRSSRGNGERKNGDLEKEIYCKDLINKLNQREEVDLPSWMVEPKIQSTPGWYLRQDLIWHKPNPMPESVTDRCTKAHEYIFLLSKSAKYYYDAEAIKVDAVTNEGQPSGVERNRIFDYDSKKNNNPEAYRKPSSWNGSSFDEGKTGEMKHTRVGRKTKSTFGNRNGELSGLHSGKPYYEVEKANKRSVWSVQTNPFPEAHFATFPPELIVDCIKAGCPADGLVLDPFNGSGTTRIVAEKLGRNSIGIELNPKYIEIENCRRKKELGMFEKVAS